MCMPANAHTLTCTQCRGCCRAEDKLPALLWLMREVVDHQTQQSIVFTATRHHVELLHALLAADGVPCACVYGAMDQVSPSGPQ